jgi:hypothetical protein
MQKQNRVLLGIIECGSYYPLRNGITFGMHYLPSELHSERIPPL